jgi:threonine dehydratase
MADSASILGIGDIEAAARRLLGVAVRTPLLQSAALDAMTGGRLLLKAEPLQRTGSFKFRGAYNTIAQTGARPVVAWSSGNHAQGVALAARLLGVHATIVMPADAPAIKLENTRAYGATVVTYDRWTESREAIGQRIAAETGAVIVKPYDDPRIMAGQGTAGLELALDAEARGLVPDALLVQASGGGLIAGIGTAMRHHFPAIEIHVTEPEGFDDHRRSLDAGHPVANAPGASTICDSLQAPQPGELTFAVNRPMLAGGLTVTDAEVEAAIRLAFRHLKLVVEPGGAVALAAALAGKLDCKGRVVAIVLSGGNVDPEHYAAILRGA